MRCLSRPRSGYFQLYSARSSRYQSAPCCCFCRGASFSALRLGFRSYLNCVDIVCQAAGYGDEPPFVRRVLFVNFQTLTYLWSDYSLDATESTYWSTARRSSPQLGPRTSDPSSMCCWCRPNSVHQVPKPADCRCRGGALELLPDTNRSHSMIEPVSAALARILKIAEQRLAPQSERSESPIE